MARGNKTKGAERRGGKKSTWAGGTTWISVPLPSVVVDRMARQGVDPRAIMISELIRAYPGLPWPEEPE